MKKVLAWVFLLIFTKLTFNLVHGEFFTLSGPPVYIRKNLLHSDRHAKDLYCITDELDSALTWNSNLEWIDSKFVDLNTVDKPFGESFKIINLMFLFKLSCTVEINCIM
jgi:hypothetical protein